MDRIHVTHGRYITEHYFIGAYAHDWTVDVEELLHGLALAETENMGGKPEVGHCIVPGAGYRAEGGDEEVVDDAEEDDGEKNGGDDENEIVAEPGDGELCRGEHGGRGKGGRWG